MKKRNVFVGRNIWVFSKQKIKKYHSSAACKLQKWWKKILLKLKDRKRTRASTMVLGFMRKVVSTKKVELIENHKKTMKLRKQYGKHVTPLQALWRGYYSRKTIMDFYKRKALLEVSFFF